MYYITGNIRVDHHDEELALICAAEANPSEDISFMWEKDNVTFQGQDILETLESEVRLRKLNENLGKDNSCINYTGVDLVKRRRFDFFFPYI